MSRRGKIAAGPFGLNAISYVRRGWSPIPVNPHSKTCAVVGYTGASGAYPDEETISGWTSEYAHNNIAIRLPKDIIGIDVDAYGTKSGADTLDELEADLGELPPTYVITSRDDGVSGIRLFRCDPDAHWKGTAGPGIDILTWYHRYAVVFPSVHPDTAREYRWYHENTDKSYRLAGCPSYRDGIIPGLPRAWHDFLHAEEAGTKAGKLSHEAIMEWLREIGRGEPCEGMKRTEAIWLDALVDAADGGGAHDAMISGVKAVIGDAVAGHPGAWDALERLKDAFRSGVSSRRSSGDASTEWRRALYGAVRLYTGTEVPEEDPCLTMAAMAEGIVLGPGAKVIDREVIRQMAHEEAVRRIASLHEAEPPVAVRGDVFMMQPIPPVRMLVDTMVPYDGNTLLVAQRKAGKTTWVHNLIRAVADGDSFLGAYETVTPGDGKSIVLFDFEMLQGMLQDWLKSQSITPRGLEKLQVLSFRGRNSSFNITSGPVRKRWSQVLADVNAGYVILDCLAPAMYASNLSEDSNSEVGLFLSLVDEMLAEAGVNGMLAVHHMGHTGERGRGASRLRDWPETELHLVIDNGDDESGKLRPNAPRYLVGEGRFGALDEVRLGHDDKSRRLYVAGGDRTTEAVESMKPRVLTYVAQNLGCSKNNIIQNVSGLTKIKQMAISSLLNEDDLLCQHSGSRGAHNMWVATECPDPKFHLNKVQLHHR